ncbi:zinc-binding alcohol dehydrogenase family protein [Acinetobacter qingfengensis]|uniref:Quinone oxidoreductase n=1 Tax=Acinetobacter qingfengensis TaxID=1262585 RepID=A0A1E7R3D9_9GAMM|nr:zinc-binding alcohol dehydrogenase family protein [Acinetobacter qingfengensis]KAA8734815.1 zinc-binding alcohol dehydrogenase family protein [Acinetobacter qingfengensis]OEY93811.1 quinone oxidoreductase [Acinetobacter qingfengensis]
MKALVTTEFGDSPVMTIEDRPIPKLKVGFSLVKIYTVTVNPLSNQIRSGLFSMAKAPLVLSNDGAGIIEESEEFLKGTRVAIYGGGQLGITEDGLQQQWTLVENKRLIALPDGYNFEFAAALPVNYVTAWQAMNRIGQIQRNDVVVISGATGAVGHALIQTAKVLGAKPIAVVSSFSKVKPAYSSGAWKVIDLSSQDMISTINEITENQGADAAFDVVGGTLFSNLITVIKPRGRLVTIGFVGGHRAEIDLVDVVVNEKRIYGYDAWMETDEQVKSVFKQITPLISSGKLMPVIDSTYDLNDFDAAYERLCSRQAVGTIILKLNN